MTDGTELFGYFARYDETTEINTWEGCFLERIRPGAFTRTLKENDGSIRLLFDHGKDPSIGRKPLGKPVLSEDVSGGLYSVELLPVPELAHIREAAAAGLLGSSFLFEPITELWTQPARPTPGNPQCLPERDLIDVNLFELGPVVFPAYKGTSPSVRDKAASADARHAARRKYARMIVAHQVRSSGATKPAVSTGSSIAARARSLQIHAKAVALGRKNCRTAAERDRSLKLERELVRGAHLLLTTRRSAEISPVATFRTGGPAMVR